MNHDVIIPAVTFVWVLSNLNGLLLDISNTIYTANANDHGACIVAMAKAREIATKGATE